MAQKILAHGFLDRSKCLRLESESLLPRSEYLFQRLKDRTVIESDLPLETAGGDHQPGHYGLQDDLFLGLANLAPGSTDALIEQLDYGLAEPATREAPEVHQDSQHSHNVLACMHIALSHQRLYELLDHVGHYVTCQVSRVNVYHGDQGAIHERLMWEVSQTRNQGLHCLMTLVLHRIV